MDRLLGYVAGPYSSLADSASLLAKRAYAAMDVGGLLWNAGAYPLVPLLTHFLEGRWRKQRIANTTSSDWYDYDRRLLEMCDFILLLPGWRMSYGCRLEHTLAEELGLPIFEMETLDKLPDDLLEWLNVR